jgi:hypothetical protein
VTQGTFRPQRRNGFRFPNDWRRLWVDIAANSSTTTSIQISDEFVGSFESLCDTDWIRIELTAGVTYAFKLGAATSSAGSFFDTISLSTMRRVRWWRRTTP